MFINLHYFKNNEKEIQKILASFNENIILKEDEWKNNKKDLQILEKTIKIEDSDYNDNLCKIYFTPEEKEKEKEKKEEKKPKKKVIVASDNSILQRIKALKLDASKTVKSKGGLTEKEQENMKELIKDYVVKIYNQYKSSFEFDNSPEPFNYNEVPNNLRINIGTNIVVNNGRIIQNNGQRYNNYNNNNSPRQSYNNNSPRQSYSNNNNNGNNSVRSRRSSHSMRDANGMNIGGVDRDGGIRNSNGIRIGNFDADGAIRDENGIRVGEIDNDGNIRNSNGIRIGDVDNNGDVRDANGIRIGEIDSEGNVRDANGVRIGSAEGMDKEQAAYMFFFK